MPRILIIDDAPMAREPIAAILNNAGFETVCADDGAQGLVLMRSEPPDLLLLDLSMPGMDGLAVLRTMRREPRLAAVPVILLTASTDKANILKGAELGVRDYLLKSRFTIAELLTRVKKYLHPRQAATSIAAANSRDMASPPPDPWATPEEDDRAILEAAKDLGIPLLTREQMMDRLEKARVKTLPGVVSDLLAMVNSPQGSVTDVAAIVRRDPVLSTRMLRAANSAANGARGAKILTIEDAVKQIGLTGVRNLVTACGIFQTMSAGAAARSLLRSWQHSLSVAALMEKLAPAKAELPAGLAYVVGLCHDLPDIVLRQHFCEEYSRVLDLTQKTRRPQRRVESAVFGMPYTELVCLLLSRLGLPPAVSAPIQQFFAHAAFAQAPAGADVMTRLLRVANLCSHGIMLSPSPDEHVMPLARIECRNLFGDLTPRLNTDELRAQAMTNAIALAGLSQTQAKDLAAPDIAKTPLHLAYVRHHDHADLDPLGMLLNQAANRLTALSEFPAGPSELQGCDALVYASSLSDNSGQIMQYVDQISMLTRSRPIPILLLSGAPPIGTATIPEHIQVRRLPTSLETIGDFLSTAAAVVGRRAA